MRSTVQHDEFGQIIYDENFWTGKKELTVNGVKLAKQQKNTFVFEHDGQSKIVDIKGGFATSAKLYIGDKVVELTPPLKWYEIVCSAVLFAIIVAWGNSVALCSIVPVIGGAFGGGITGAMAFLCLILMKNQNKLWAKLLVWLGMLAATFVVCFLAAIVFVYCLSLLAA